jgi:hypothetical protein
MQAGAEALTVDINKLLSKADASVAGDNTCNGAENVA